MRSESVPDPSAAHHRCLTPNDRPLHLAGQIIHGAEIGDAVELHGAIVTTLEVHGVADAVEFVFAPSIRVLTGQPRRRASVAMGGHLAAYLAQPGSRGLLRMPPRV